MACRWKKIWWKIHHVADSLKWKKNDLLFLNFSHEPRILGLGLPTDQMSLFGNLSTNHTLWHVLLRIYNSSSWLCMKRKYLTLSMMTSGLKQSGTNIDVYLKSLIKDFKVYRKKVWMLMMRIRLKFLRCLPCCFCIINEACSICEADTYFHHLKNVKKTIYLGNQKISKT